MSGDTTGDTTAAAGSTVTAPPGGRLRWLGLVVIALGISMIIVDSTIVNVAVPPGPD